MTKVTPTYELKTDVDLSKFLLGAIRDVRKKELDHEKAAVIAQLADKYTKNEVMRCLKSRLTKNIQALEIDGELNKMLMQKTD